MSSASLMFGSYCGSPLLAKGILIFVLGFAAVWCLIRSLSRGTTRTRTTSRPSSGRQLVLETSLSRGVRWAQARTGGQSAQWLVMLLRCAACRS